MKGVDSVKQPPVVLQSLADGGSQVSGSFFLGSGVIDSDSVYTWYESTGENAYVQKQVDVEHATIITWTTTSGLTTW